MVCFDIIQYIIHLCLRVHLLIFFFFFLMIRRPPRSTLFPYTTLFRSQGLGQMNFLTSPITHLVIPKFWAVRVGQLDTDRKSTRLNSSHLVISYAVFCLKKKKNILTSITDDLS